MSFDKLSVYSSNSDNLKKMVTIALIFVYYKLNVMIIVETDLSDYVTSRMLSQLGDDKLLHSIIFFFKNLNPVKYNYNIYYKELFAIIQNFK